jgi:diguanylate cyclase (GGDEF)-like protein
MESMPARARVAPPLDGALLAAAAKRAAGAAGESAEPATSIDAAVEALYAAPGGILPSVFVLEHGRLWLVAQRGYSVVSDGIRVDSGIMGRAARMGRTQLVPDVSVDPDYVGAHPRVHSELAVPLRAGSTVVGVFNIESERALPDGAVGLIAPLAVALAPLVQALRTSRTLDLAGLARLFVHLGSLRDPEEIAALAAASLPKVLPIEGGQVLVWDEFRAPVELGSSSSDTSNGAHLSPAELEAVRAVVDPTVVCQVLDVGLARGRSRAMSSVVWLPLRANGDDLGALVGCIRAAAHVDPVQLDTAAVLAAHVAASLDAAFALRRERQSAATDPLTGILNRRGLEERLERDLASAQADRVPLSLLVIDCDDFKEINDRAGHEFGDALLREVADVLEGALPEGAVAARLGGDEFVVLLPGADADVAEALSGQIRSRLGKGLTEAGFPLRMSAGISTYPFDGAGAPTLLRAADQALYAAKSFGKDRVASFRDIVRPRPAAAGAAVSTAEARRQGVSGGSGSVLVEVVAASKAIEAEETIDGVYSRLCKALVFIIGATGCLASRVVGDYVVDATKHALREVSLGDEAAYRIADFPLTAEVLRTGEPRVVSFVDGEVDPAEAFILRELGMNALLMLPLRVGGKPWGLVELYEMRLRLFTEDDVAIAQFLTAQAERRLELMASAEAPRERPPVYELPPDDEAPRVPRKR